MTQAAKAMLGLVAVSLLLSGFYFLDWREKHQQLRVVGEETRQRQSRLAELRERIRGLPELSREVEELEKRLRVRVASEEPPEAVVPNFLTEIEGLTRQDLAIVSLTPGPVQPRGEGDEVNSVPGRSINLEMTGRYSCLTALLRRLAALDLGRVVTVERLQIGLSGGPTGGDPLLTVSMPLVIFPR